MVRLGFLQGVGTFSLALGKPVRWNRYMVLSSLREWGIEASGTGEPKLPFPFCTGKAKLVPSFSVSELCPWPLCLWASAVCQPRRIQSCVSERFQKHLNKLILLSLKWVGERLSLACMSLMKMKLHWVIYFISFCDGDRDWLLLTLSIPQAFWTLIWFLFFLLNKGRPLKPIASKAPLHLTLRSSDAYLMLLHPDLPAAHPSSLSGFSLLILLIPALLCGCFHAMPMLHIFLLLCSCGNHSFLLGVTFWALTD